MIDDLHQLFFAVCDVVYYKLLKLIHLLIKLLDKLNQLLISLEQVNILLVAQGEVLLQLLVLSAEHQVFAYLLVDLDLIIVLLFHIGFLLLLQFGCHGCAV